MNDLLDKVQMLKNTYVAIATGASYEGRDYKTLREEIIGNIRIKAYIPDFLKQCRTIGEFWEYIKHLFPTYHERRTFIWEKFKPLLEYLEEAEVQPLDLTITEKLKKYGMSFIQEYWDKALERRKTDPEGAITASRTLIETVCKHILEKLGVEYNIKAELPELYKMTAKNLNLSPEEHQEEIFKQILGGCISIVNGIGSLRNQISDSHGKSTKYIRPAERHATLVVNLSGTMAQFFMETYENIVEKKTT